MAALIVRRILGQDVRLQTRLGSHQRYQIARPSRVLVISLVCLVIVPIDQTSGVGSGRSVRMRPGRRAGSGGESEFGQPFALDLQMYSFCSVVRAGRQPGRHRRTGGLATRGWAGELAAGRPGADARGGVSRGLQLTTVCGRPSTLPSQHAPHSPHTTNPCADEVAHRHGFAVPVSELGEEGKAMLVGGDGLIEPPSPLQSIAEVVQRSRFAVAVAELGEEGGGLLVGGDGLIEPPHLLQGDAEVAHRHGLAVPVSELGEEGKAMLVGGDRLIEPPQVPQGEAEIGQRLGLAVPVGELSEDGGSLLVGGDRLIEPPYPVQGCAKIVQRHGLAVPLAELGEDGDGLLMGCGRLVEPPHLPQGEAESGQHHGFAVLTTGLLRGIGCCLARRDHVVEVASPFQEAS